MDTRRKWAAAAAALVLLGMPACDGGGDEPEVETGEEAGDPGDAPGTEEEAEEATESP